MMRKFIEAVEKNQNSPKMITTNDAIISKKGTAGMPDRMVSARSGDNAMKDIRIDEFAAEEDILDRLHDILQNADVSDEAIKSGVLLTAMGLKKLSDHFGLDTEQVKLLISSLSSKLREEDKISESYQHAMEELRFSAEEDLNGGVTIRDSKTGDKKVLTGTTGTQLLRKLSSLDTKEKQDEMQKLFEDIDDDHPFKDEINQQSGTYNFTTKLDGQLVYATASFRLKDGMPDIRVISVRDKNGDDIKLSSRMSELLHSAAIDAMDDV